MIELNGKYNIAKVFTDNIEQTATSQIIELCNQEFIKGSKIRIMSDVHAGAGCTIGTTMTIKNKVVPNLVGVDIGCFVGETKIPLINGTQKTLKELSKLNEYFYVYSVNKKGEITYGKANAFKTRENANLVKVTISGGSEIICTPDHRFMNRDGSYTEAKDLKHLDSLMPLYRTYQTRDGYESIIQPNNKKLPLNTHKLIAKTFYGEIPEGMVVHHKDDNKFNNCPENLQILSAQEHSKIHGKSLKVSKRLKSEEFKTNRKEKLEINGYYNENLYEKKKEVGIINITNYMKNNKEHFEKVVEANAERGSKFFNDKNSDEVMITKQKLGRLRKILLNIINNNENVDEYTYEKYRKDYYNYPKYNKYLELIKELGLSTEDIINKKYDKAFNNHKVISVEALDYKEDVYCLNVEEHHNFALTAGVFVHNCGMLTVKLKDKEIDFQKLDYIIRQHIPNGQNVRQTYHKNNSKIDLQELRCKGKLNIDRAMKSLGTLGGGNHFTEINKDSKGNLYLVIHSGSRYLGKQVAEYYQDLAFKTLSENVQDKSKLIDKLKSEGKANLIQQELKKIKPLKVNRQLAYLEGSDFDDYLYDMDIVQKYANINRETMAEEILKHTGLIEESSFSTIHNYIDLENMILRKGAISSQKGETMLIPMNMRDGSLLCIGKGNEDWNYSAPHGAGRILSRSKAKEKITLDEFKNSMNGIWTSSVCESTIDESPMTYKPMQEIIDNIGDTVEIIDILKPLYNFKSSS
jgi:tRNA-splicing ligase RtcB (3'-phosphate/5'-hydroxy nucleic acid ligase)